MTTFMLWAPKNLTWYSFACTILFVRVVWARELVRLKALTLANIVDTLNKFIWQLENFLGTLEISTFDFFMGTVTLQIWYNGEKNDF